MSDDMPIMSLNYGLVASMYILKSVISLQQVIVMDPSFLRVSNSEKNILHQVSILTDPCHL